MWKNLRRSIRRFQYDLSTALSSRHHANHQDRTMRYYVTIFILLGIVIFASLHTLFSMMMTQVTYKQTGYLDLYGEDLSMCWNSILVSSGINTPGGEKWITSLKNVKCSSAVSAASAWRASLVSNSTANTKKSTSSSANSGNKVTSSIKTGNPSSGSTTSSTKIKPVASSKPTNKTSSGPKPVAKSLSSNQTVSIGTGKVPSVTPTSLRGDKKPTAAVTNKPTHQIQIHRRLTGTKHKYNHHVAKKRGNESTEIYTSIRSRNNERYVLEEDTMNCSALLDPVVFSHFLASTGSVNPAGTSSIATTIQSSITNPTSPRLVDAGICFTVPNTNAFYNIFQQSQTQVQCLPSFIIAGAMKSATGELMKWLDLHPYLQSGKGKGKQGTAMNEIHFFSRSFAQTVIDEHVVTSTPHSQGTLTGSASGTSSFPNLPLTHNGHQAITINTLETAKRYSEYFPIFSTYEASTVYTFDKSPDYMRSPTAMERIHHIMPSVKLILILRNPSIRAVSEFNHHCRHKRYLKLIKTVTLLVPSLGGTGVVGTTGSTSTSSAGSITMIYRKGMVLRDLSASKDPNEGREEGLHDHYFSIDSRTLPEDSFIHLSYPCTVDDMMAYFRKDVDSMTTGSGDSVSDSNNAGDSSGSRVERMLEADRVKLPREIIHGFYDHQIKHILNL